MTPRLTCLGQLLGVAMAVLSPLLYGCESTSAAPSDLPSLTEIRSNPIPPPERLIESPPTRWALAVNRIDLPLATPLNAVWDVVDEQAVSDLTRAVWQANGLRLGLLDPPQLEELGKQLPPPVAVGGSTILNAGLLTPLRSVRVSGEPVPVDLTVPPLSVERALVRAGRLQLLVAQQDTGGGSRLDLVPHQYLPKASLVPRDPLERRLDGQVFEQLAARVQLQPGQYLVVGLYWPWIEQIDPNWQNPYVEPEAVDQVAPGPAATQPTVIDSPPMILRQPPLPASLGRSLFAGEARGRPVQVLLVISLARPPAGL